ncbi:hypothetical protein KIP36_16390, partial [Xanthomonas campestris pv. campestris]
RIKAPLLRERGWGEGTAADWTSRTASATATFNHSTSTSTSTSTSVTGIRNNNPYAHPALRAAFSRRENEHQPEIASRSW